MEWFDKNAAAVIAATAALSASLIAGTFALLGAWLNHTYSNRLFNAKSAKDVMRDNKTLYLDKGEELHSLLTRWGNTAYAHFLIDENFILGRISKEERHHLLMDKFDPEIFTRASSLIAIYFSELLPMFNQIRQRPIEAGGCTDSFENGTLNMQVAYESHKRYSMNFTPELQQLKAGLQKTLLKQLET